MESNEIKEIYYQEKDSFLNEYIYSLVMDTLTEKFVYIHGDEKKSDEKKLSSLELETKLKDIYNITKDFKNEYINSNVLDGKEYKIYILYKNGEKKKVIGKNKFPDGFSSFIRLIKGE